MVVKVRVHRERASCCLYYLSTRLLFRGHLQSSRKHLNTWSVYKALPRLKTRSLSVPSITYRKSGIPFTLIPNHWGFLGTPVVVGLRAFSGWTRLLLDAVTQQPTGSQGAGVSDTPARLEVEAGLGVRETSGSTKPRPPRNSATRSPARLELLHVGGAGASKHRLLLNNVDSGGVPDPEVELPSHRSG